MKGTKATPEIMKVIYANQYSNFEQMNMIHSCVLCGKDEILMPPWFIKQGKQPACREHLNEKYIKDMMDMEEEYKKLGQSRFDKAENCLCRRCKGEEKC